jgi:hypothetical protein
MAIKLDEKNDGKLLEVQISGKLVHEDYLHFGPEFDRMVEKHGKIRILFEMVDFHGWNAAALWDDIKLEIKHHADIEKIAMVGDTKWEEGMSVFCKPFTSAQIRYFDHEAIEEARTWIESD